MILVDTSVWVDHLRDGDAGLAALLERREVLMHPWVVGELALGRLRNREEILRLLDQLPRATVATVEELSAFIEDHALYGRGIGYVDVQLLAATRLTPDTRLWTRDRRLRDAAKHVGAAHA